MTADIYSLTSLRAALYWVGALAFLIWLLSGRARTPLRGFAGLACYGGFIYLLDKV